VAFTAALKLNISYNILTIKHFYRKKKGNKIIKQQEKTANVNSIF
jgi:hypothetical protein